MMNLEQMKSGSMVMVDKPYGWTSFDVIRKLRAASGIRKIGHAGTLDPLATGLLILCTGKKTKEIDQYQSMEKEYEGTLVLGKTTPSVDLETAFDSEQDCSLVTTQQIKDAAREFTGNIEQIPPSYSAIKVKGQRVYEKARRGETVILPPRQVEVKEFEILRYEIPEVLFRVVCSKGTYIRSLVRDLGERLQVGAYLSTLSRTRIGPHQLSMAYNMDELVKQISQSYH